MKTYHTFFLVVGCLVSLTGCTAYPAGLTRSEWEALTPAKQAEYRKLQKIQDAQKQSDADQQRTNAESERRAVEQSLWNGPLR